MGEGIHTSADRLVRVETKLDIVIGQHDKDIADNKVTIASAHNRIDTQGIHLATLDTWVTDLRAKSLGAFGKFMVGVSGAVGVGGLITVWVK